MKRTAVIAVILLVGICTGVVLSGCSSIRMERVSGSDFMSRAERIDTISSAGWTTYLGCSHERAYIEFEHPAFIGTGTTVIVYWTPLSELPEDVARKLEAGEPPWKPWQSETDGTEKASREGK